MAEQSGLRGYRPPRPRRQEGRREEKAGSPFVSARLRMDRTSPYVSDQFMVISTLKSLDVHVETFCFLPILFQLQPAFSQKW